MRVLGLLFVLGTLAVGCGGDSNEPWQPNVTAVDADGVWQMRAWNCIDDRDCPSRVLFGGHGYSVGCAEVDPDLVGALVAVRDEHPEEVHLRSDYAQARTIAAIDARDAVALGPEGSDCQGQIVERDYWQLAVNDTSPAEIADPDLCRVLLEPVGLNCS
jgi:hypothetical protein